MLLDLVEVAMSHSGVNLAETFVKVLRDFGIEEKVSFNYQFGYTTKFFYLTYFSDPKHYL